ncbi:hypothetical protein P3472_18165 [Vibrio parahaemolyticus]|nr:hypothetical protein [Vibrio parahaemolyticus]
MQKVKIGPVPVPFFRLNNVVELEEIVCQRDISLHTVILIGIGSWR